MLSDVIEVPVFKLSIIFNVCIKNVKLLIIL